MMDDLNAHFGLLIIMVGGIIAIITSSDNMLIIALITAIFGLCYALYYAGTFHDIKVRITANRIKESAL